MNNIVYTYYDGIHEGDGDVLSEDAKKQYELMAGWKRSWSKRGWSPQVLTAKDAMLHPLYDIYTERCSKLPTANMPAYEMACYHRWLAVAAKGGGFMSDYDVINYSFTPTRPQADLVIFESSSTEDNVTPSVVGGSAAGFTTAAMMFATCDGNKVRLDEGGTPHTSDMIILQHMKHSGIYATCPIVKQYGTKGWKEAPLVHFSHGATRNINRGKFALESRPI